ncbi:MAG: hypothetical protein WD875_15295 [Pirellulales bacterium]
MSKQTNKPPVLVLTVELPALLTRARGRAAFDNVASVIRRVRSHQVAATWGVAFGTSLAQVADALHINAAGGNELAWSAEAVWAGPNVSRGRFAVALAERLSAALDAGIAMPTLITGRHGLPAHLDVATKYGVRAVVREGTRQRSAGQPQALRFGIWSVDITSSLSSAGSWWTNAARQAEREINRAIRTASVCHLHADLSRPETVAVLDRVLAHVQRCRMQGGLHVETVGQLAARLSRPRVAARPARSILRAA